MHVLKKIIAACALLSFASQLWGLTIVYGGKETPFNLQHSSQISKNIFPNIIKGVTIQDVRLGELGNLNEGFELYQDEALKNKVGLPESINQKLYLKILKQELFEKKLQEIAEQQKKEKHQEVIEQQKKEVQEAREKRKREREEQQKTFAEWQRGNEQWKQTQEIKEQAKKYNLGKMLKEDEQAGLLRTKTSFSKKKEKEEEVVEKSKPVEFEKDPEQIEKESAVAPKGFRRRQGYAGQDGEESKDGLKSWWDWQEIGKQYFTKAKEKFGKLKQKALQERIIRLNIPVFMEKISYQKDKGKIETTNNGQPIINDNKEVAKIEVEISVKQRITKNISYNTIKKAIEPEIASDNYRYVLWVKTASVSFYSKSFFSEKFLRSEIVVAPLTLAKSERDPETGKLETEPTDFLFKSKGDLHAVSDIYYAQLKNLPANTRNKIPLDTLFDEQSKKSPMFILIRQEKKEKEKLEPSVKTDTDKAREIINKLVMINLEQTEHKNTLKVIADFTESQTFTDMQKREKALQRIDNFIYNVRSTLNATGKALQKIW